MGSFRERVQKSLGQRSCQEHLVWRSYRNTLYRNLLRSCQEVSDRDLAKRPRLEILYRHLARTSLFWDLVQRHGKGTCCRDLAKRCFIKKNLANKTLIEILYRDMVKRAVVVRNHVKIPWTEILPWNLAQQFLQRSSQKELAESYLAPLLTETTLNEHRTLATRVAQACTRW